MLLHLLVGDAKTLKSLYSLFYFPWPFKLLEDQLEHEVHIESLKFHPRCLGKVTHGSLQLSDQSFGFPLRGILAQPFREARVKGGTLNKQGRGNRRGQAKVREQGPILVRPELNVYAVTQGNVVRCKSHRLNVI